MKTQYVDFKTEKVNGRYLPAAIFSVVVLGIKIPMRTRFVTVLEEGRNANVPSLSPWLFERLSFPTEAEANRYMDSAIDRWIKQHSKTKFVFSCLLAPLS